MGRARPTGHMSFLTGQYRTHKFTKKICLTYFFLTTLSADATLALGEIADDSNELAWQYIFFKIFVTVSILILFSIII